MSWSDAAAKVKVSIKKQRKEVNGECSHRIVLQGFFNHDSETFIGARILAS